MQSFCNVNPTLAVLSVESAARQRWTRKIFKRCSFTTVCQSWVSEEESETVVGYEMDAVQVMAYLRKRSSACSIWWDSSVLDYTSGWEGILSTILSAFPHLAYVFVKCNVRIWNLFSNHMCQLVLLCLWSATWLWHLLFLIFRHYAALISSTWDMICFQHSISQLRLYLLFSSPYLVISQNVAQRGELQSDTCDRLRNGEEESLIHWFKTVLDVYVSS